MSSCDCRCCFRRWRFKTLDAGLAGLRFVQRTELASFDAGLATYMVHYLGSAKTLAEELSALKTPRLSVDNVTPNAVRVNVDKR